MNSKPRRLSWDGLLRMLGRNPRGNYFHRHVYMVDLEGHRKYLQLKRMADGSPYFVEVRETGGRKE